MQLIFSCKRSCSKRLKQWRGHEFARAIGGFAIALLSRYSAPISWSVDPIISICLWPSISYSTVSCFFLVFGLAVTGLCPNGLSCFSEADDIRFGQVLTLTSEKSVIFQKYSAFSWQGVRTYATHIVRLRHWFETFQTNVQGKTRFKRFF